MTSSPDLRQYAPATQRNREPILQVLRQVLPETGTVLEISSGTGEHATFFAPQFPALWWIPSDINPTALASIAAWRDYLPSAHLTAPIVLDVTAPIWPIEQSPLPEPLQQFNLAANPLRAIVNINMIHIAPWSACQGLMAGAERTLPVGGILYLYGPFKRQNQPTAPSNLDFDESLRRQNPEWGVRNLEEVMAVAQNHRLMHRQIVEMPANNLSVIFEKA